MCRDQPPGDFGRAPQAVALSYQAALAVVVGNLKCPALRQSPPPPDQQPHLGQLGTSPGKRNKGKQNAVRRQSVYMTEETLVIQVQML